MWRIKNRDQHRGAASVVFKVLSPVSQQALKLPDRQLRTLSTPPTAGAQVKIIELDLADQLAIGHLELVQMRTIPTRECRIHRISELAELVRPGRGENPTRPRPIILTMTTDQIHPNRQPRPRQD